MTSLWSQDYWLGMTINGERYALSTNLVHSVFFSLEPEQSVKDLRISGVVIREGEPVYMRTHFQLLKFRQGDDVPLNWQQILKREHAPWVVVLKEEVRQGVGFRVNNIVGPFKATRFDDSASLQFNGSDFHLIGVV
jgi:hypothetical protein